MAWCNITSFLLDLQATGRIRVECVTKKGVQYYGYNNASVYDAYNAAAGPKAYKQETLSKALGAAVKRQRITIKRTRTREVWTVLDGFNAAAAAEQAARQMMQQYAGLRDSAAGGSDPHSCRVSNVGPAGRAAAAADACSDNSLQESQPCAGYSFVPESEPAEEDEEVQGRPDDCAAHFVFHQQVMAAVDNGIRPSSFSLAAPARAAKRIAQLEDDMQAAASKAATQRAMLEQDKDLLRSRAEAAEAGQAHLQEELEAVQQQLQDTLDMPQHRAQKFTAMYEADLDAERAGRERLRERYRLKCREAEELLRSNKHLKWQLVAMTTECNKLRREADKAKRNREWQYAEKMELYRVTGRKRVWFGPVKWGPAPSS